VLGRGLRLRRLHLPAASDASPEIDGFVAVAPPANHYDLAFLAPCPASGIILAGEKDIVAPPSDIDRSLTKVRVQKGEVIERANVPGANHFFQGKLEELEKISSVYLKKRMKAFEKAQKEAAEGKSDQGRRETPGPEPAELTPASGRHAMSDTPEPFFHRDGDVYTPTLRANGWWKPTGNLHARDDRPVRACDRQQFGEPNLQPTRPTADLYRLPISIPSLSPPGSCGRAGASRSSRPELVLRRHLVGPRLLPAAPPRSAAGSIALVAAKLGRTAASPGPAA